MQRVTNCVLNREGKVLMLQKPRRGWWTAPGGKMEAHETIEEAVLREFEEETGLRLMNPQLKGVFTILMKEDGEVIDEWMMFTFVATEAEGEVFEECEEGVLEWHAADAIQHLPTAEGDQHFLTPIAKGTDLMIGKFEYTPDFKLLSADLGIGRKGKHA
jgi:8-oxo-dGTP diphosphatase